MPTPISAIVLTKNEAHHIRACLASLRWADEVLVVDSLSTDDTVALARAAGARVIEHPFSNFAAQHNFAQAQAAHHWVLFVDADERVSEALAAEIRALAQAEALDACSAYHIERLHLISGRWFYSRPGRRVTAAHRQRIRRDEVPRLLDRRRAVWTRAVHEAVQAPEPHGVLDGVICHYSGSNLSSANEAFNAYSDLEAALLHRAQPPPLSLWHAAWRGARTFAYLYLVRGWVRYGQHGLLLALAHGYSKYMNYAKLWERQRIDRGDGEWTDLDRALLTRYRVDDDAGPP